MTQTNKQKEKPSTLPEQTKLHKYKINLAELDKGGGACCQ